MINLIPNEEKKKMSKDFYFRLLAMLFVVLGVSLLVATIAALPAFFVSLTEKNIINQKLESGKNEPIPLSDQNILISVEDLKNKLNQVENSEKNSVNLSQKIINGIILKKIPGIKISGISYKNDELDGEKIIIIGKASNRELLLSFSKALEGDITFSKVDLPISNFIKGSDIEFNLTLTLNKGRQPL